MVSSGADAVLRMARRAALAAPEGTEPHRRRGPRDDGSFSARSSIRSFPIIATPRTRFPTLRSRRADLKYNRAYIIRRPDRRRANAFHLAARIAAMRRVTPISGYRSIMAWNSGVASPLRGRDAPFVIEPPEQHFSTGSGFANTCQPDPQIPVGQEEQLLIKPAQGAQERASSYYVRSAWNHIPGQ